MSDLTLIKHARTLAWVSLLLGLLAIGTALAR